MRIKKHHDRRPDVGVGILVHIPNTGQPGKTTEYYGEYLGHGQSKTAFELHCPDERFHGKVLKVTATANDMEPSVFMKASEFALTTSILYDCHGVDGDSKRRYRCWITDRTIPLDEICRYEGAIKSRCSLAAFCCILRAAQRGLNLSDCHFFNFGVPLTESATEHLVVIIDAGSRGIHSDAVWKKSDINTAVMHKFWKACAEESATNAEIIHLWQSNDNYTIEKCLEEATRAWESWPFLTKDPVSSVGIWQAMNADKAFRRSRAQVTGAYKVMEIVGRFTAEDQWSAACALVCYEASRAIDDLSSEENQILDELYSRIIRTRDADDDLYDVMAFWRRLHEYGERERCRMLQSRGDQSVTPEQASQIYESFKWNELWYDLTWEQQQNKGWRSTTQTLLHRQAGWAHAARAILEYGLPKIEQAIQSTDATEHINAIGQFARDLAEWLKGFASRMHAYQNTVEYQNELQKSMKALAARKRRAEETR